MPLQVKSISMSIAVICFFIIAFFGWFAQLDPFVCGKRAIVGAVITYLVSKTAVNIINNILISALVKARMEQQKRELNGYGN